LAPNHSSVGFLRFSRQIGRSANTATPLRLHFIGGGSRAGIARHA
jgi:hypothetical protein